MKTFYIKHSIIFNNDKLNYSYRYIHYMYCVNFPPKYKSDMLTWKWGRGYNRIEEGQVYAYLLVTQNYTLLKSLRDRCGVGSWVCGNTKVWTLNQYMLNKISLGEGGVPKWWQRWHRRGGEVIKKITCADGGGSRKGQILII